MISFSEFWIGMSLWIEYIYWNANKSSNKVKEIDNSIEDHTEVIINEKAYHLGQ
jgi:hypothetical protein